MANFNSTASQILNWTANFLNWVSNAARDVVANPLADMANIWLKTNPYVAAANLATKWKVYNAIDTVTSAAKWEQPHALQKQPEDPTSLAYAAWEWLTRWVDAAVAVVSLADLAKQLPKAAQAWWKTILNKVKDAKSKSQQMKLAKEARDYVTKHIEINDNLSKRMYNQSAEVPAYQQRAFAKENPGMARYKTNAAEVNFAETKGWDTSTPLHPMTSYDNGLKQKLTLERAAQLWVPYGKQNMNTVRNVQQEVQDLAKMSDKEFMNRMWNKAAAARAWYNDWRYDLWDDWAQNWNNPKEYQRMKGQVIDNILNDAWLDYWVSEAYGNAIKSNAVKSSKKYRNWLKKEAKNTYEKNTQPITRAERNAADMNAAEAEKKEIMNQYWISSKDYDEYADAAANTYIYIDKNWNPVNKMAWAGWPSGWSYFIDEKAEVMPYLKWYARRHPTVDEYIRMAEEEAELGRLAEEEAASIAAEEAAYKHEGNPAFRL